MARLKKIDPAFTAPWPKVYIVSDGSIGEMVEPVMRHCTKWAIISRFTVISETARHRLMRERRVRGSPTIGSSRLRGCGMTAEHSPCRWDFLLLD